MFVVAADLTKLVSAIVPVASHTGEQFNAGAGFDVNPVVWKTLAVNGVCLRGPVAWLFDTRGPPL